VTDRIDLLTTAEYQVKLNTCIHCGLCLEACPTYPVFGGTEMDGPRGRIALMRAVSDGRASPDDRNFTTHIDRCLGCLSCESACPSGVSYRDLVAPARQAIANTRTISPAERFVRWLGLRQLMPHVQRLRLIAWMAWLFQVLGLHRLLRALPGLPEPLRTMTDIVPSIVPRYRDYRNVTPALGERRGRVAFFVGCIQEAFLAPVNDATIRVLQRNGYEVSFPQLQTCCGAAQVHVGEAELACALARRNIDAFSTQDVDAIIVNAGGCGLALKEYAELLHDDPNYAEQARQFSMKVQDINEFLAEHLHVPPQGAVPARATYVDSCHLRHGQRVVRQPRELLRRIRGLELIELQRPDHCCGSAGTYNLANPEAAAAILEAKMADVAATGAKLIVTSNTGCHMQLIAGVRRSGMQARVMHVVEVLNLAYEGKG
jgi:glycolate oxidase iron-sulfur subunit